MYKRQNVAGRKLKPHKYKICFNCCTLKQNVCENRIADKNYFRIINKIINN